MISKRLHNSFPHGEGRVPRRFKGTAIYWVGLLVLCGLLLPSVGQARLRNSVQRDQWLPVLDIPNQVSVVSDRCDGISLDVRVYYIVRRQGGSYRAFIGPVRRCRRRSLPAGEEQKHMVAIIKMHDHNYVER